MAHDWQLTVDCAEPHRMAAFWSAALGYEVEDHQDLIERLAADGVIEPDEHTTLVGGRRAWVTAAAVRDRPSGRRLLFQQVPEPKTVKNRWHIDVNAGPERLDAEVERLVGLGATVVRTVREPGTHHVVMLDVEGNEFCVQ
ncbi:VOC family protein [Nocardiopsis sp. NPDC057823]|uniref:VOC family protein n=1 Tax=Nocardiopsis TaxID=2013 RepID=UPI001599F49D|nr:VOC family protein [Nocardiopsis flavescens]